MHFSDGNPKFSWWQHTGLTMSSAKRLDPQGSKFLTTHLQMWHDSFSHDHRQWQCVSHKREQQKSHHGRARSLCVLEVICKNDSTKWEWEHCWWLSMCLLKFPEWKKMMIHHVSQWTKPETEKLFWGSTSLCDFSNQQKQSWKHLMALRTNYFFEFKTQKAAY